MKFSIIIPVYNVEEYLGTCISSILNQTYNNYEIILIDDGSTDICGELCDEWQRYDRRIYVIHQKNQGSSVSRNNGLKCACGDYILFLDSDDYWVTDVFLEKLSEYIDSEKPDVIIYNLQKVYKDKIDVPYFSLEIPTLKNIDNSIDYIHFNNLWTACAWNKAVKRELFCNEQLLFREGITSEDIDWCMRLAITANKFGFLNICAVGYRQRLDSISGSITEVKFDILLKNIEYCEFLLKNVCAKKRKLLESYIAYQYGTVLYLLNSVTYTKDKYQYIYNKSYMLAWSENKKIRLLYKANQILGFKGMLLLLVIKRQYNTIIRKRI